MHKLILISGKMGSGKTVLVDRRDLKTVIKNKWWIKNHRNTFYAVTDICKKRVYMHRLIMKAKKNQIVDHIDGNGLNNSKSNLRFCTNSQNIIKQNRINRKNRYRGVSWSKDRKCWHAKITVNYKTMNLGRFKNIKDAALAYDNAAKKHFGQFSVLNFK